MFDIFNFFPMIVFIVAMVALLSNAIKILPEYERGVLFRLGRLKATRGPGLVFIIPGIDRLVRVSLRIVALDVPPQDVISRDNVTVKVSAVIYFRVTEAEKAIVQVENYLYATSQLAQTTLRSVLGQVELDELLANREKINKELQEILANHIDPWGVKVTAVEVKNIDLPLEMQRAIAKQAEAERERRAKIIHAEGELQASEKLAQAAKMLASEPSSMQLRYLQTLTEIAAEKNSTTIFPVPIDLITQFLDRKKSD
ncbi:slipin family protein [Geobacter pelophilus]|jgi:regulator of protease activity HflC (stomatin/prohibitin superfamily)|uniref:Slipin family protein n=1 Tax=Geoanaerobacter pelophilus TaxID=60036 RepID=A0AAW4L0A9_9BACT|nr:slipin family protein [Geoanaerobacter pelophilus]MBT0662952.1 slipin family protein [Geoanaerobacter pelophilus]